MCGDEIHESIYPNYIDWYRKIISYSPIRLLIIPQSDPHDMCGHYNCLHGCMLVPAH